MTFYDLLALLLVTLWILVTIEEALINSVPPSWRIFFTLSVSTNPPHSLCYASGLSP